MDSLPPSPNDQVPWWLDPGRWNVPSPLAVGAVALLAVATAATWWSMRQPLRVGVPALLLVLFAELVLALGLIAARARSVFWEYSARIAKLENVLQDLRGFNPAGADLQGHGQRPEPQDRTPPDAIRRDIALLEERLAESVAQVRYDVEDGKILLFDLLDRSDGAGARGSESA